MSVYVCVKLFDCYLYIYTCCARARVCSCAFVRDCARVSVGVCVYVSMSVCERVITTFLFLVMFQLVYRITQAAYRLCLHSDE